MNFHEESWPSLQRAARPLKKIDFIPLYVKLDQIWDKALSLAEFVNRRHIDSKARRRAVSERRTVGLRSEAYRP
jgi:hypothetical protein